MRRRTREAKRLAEAVVEERAHPADDLAPVVPLHGHALPPEELVGWTVIEPATGHILDRWGTHLEYRAHLAALKAEREAREASGVGHVWNGRAWETCGRCAQLAAENARLRLRLADAEAAKCSRCGGTGVVVYTSSNLVYDHSCPACRCWTCGRPSKAQRCPECAEQGGAS